MGKKYIDADLLLENLKKQYGEDLGWQCTVNMCDVGNMIEDCIDNTPTADVQEVRHGKWIYKGHHEMMGHAFECSVCERWMFTNSTEHIAEEYPYCHCGAKMDLEKQRNDL